MKSKHVLFFVDPIGSRYTFLTAEGGVEGTFDTPTNISAILKPVLTYGANSVSVTIDATGSPR